MSANNSERNECSSRDTHHNFEPGQSASVSAVDRTAVQHETHSDEHMAKSQTDESDKLDILGEKIDALMQVLIAWHDSRKALLAEVRALRKDTEAMQKDLTKLGKSIKSLRKGTTTTVTEETILTPNGMIRGSTVRAGEPKERAQMALKRHTYRM